MRIVEIILWIAAATALAYFSNDLVLQALILTYGNPANAPPLLLQNLVYVGPVFPLMLGIAATIRLRLGSVRLGEVFGFSRRTLAGDLGLGIVVGAASVAVTVGAMTLARPYFPPVPAADFPPHLHLYFMTVGAVIPGFCEELFFRGMLFRIGANTPGWLLVLLSAAGFALWHLNTPLYLVHTFVLGVMFGVLVLMTKRVAPAAIAHTVANAAFGALLLTGVISASG